MKRWKSLLWLVLVLTLVILGPDSASAEKKLTLLTWMAPQNEAMFRSWIEEFKKAHPEVTFEWLDKKGTEWAAYYQT